MLKLFINIYLCLIFISTCYCNNNAQTEESFLKSVSKLQERIQQNYDTPVIVVRKLTVEINPEKAETTIMVISDFKIEPDGKPKSYADIFNIPNGVTCSYEVTQSFTNEEHTSWGISAGAHGSRSVSLLDKVFKSVGANIDANYQEGNSKSSTYTTHWSETVTGPMNGNLMCQRYIAKGKAKIAKKTLEYSDKTFACSMDDIVKIRKANDECFEGHKEMQYPTRFKFCSNMYQLDQFNCLKKEHGVDLFKEEDFKEEDYQEIAADSNGKTFVYCGIVALDSPEQSKLFYGKEFKFESEDHNVGGTCPKH